MRRAQLMAIAASGNPNRFLTLTINPSIGESPEARLKLLSNAWRTIVKRLRRLWGRDTIHYLAVVEATKAGEPHLHILLRSPFIDQRMLSDAMSELVQSPIVDIRKVRNPRDVIRYIAKYLTKDNHHFGTSKRYWKSKNYEAPYEPSEEVQAHIQIPWKIERRRVDEIIQEWCYAGYAVRRFDADTLYAEPGAWIRGQSP